MWTDLLQSIDEPVKWSNNAVIRKDLEMDVKSSVLKKKRTIWIVSNDGVLVPMAWVAAHL